MVRMMRAALLLATSALMAVEAGEYYAGFYPAQVWRGYALAALAEVFLVLALAIRLPDRPWLRAAFRGTGLLLFLVVVLGASARDAAQGWRQWAAQAKRERSLQTLERVLEARSSDLTLVQGQRTNTVLGIQSRRAVEDQLLQAQAQPAPEGLLGLLLLGLTVLLRLAIQTGNALLAHSLSRPWGKKEEAAEHPASANLRRTLGVIRTQGQGQLRCIARNAFKELY